MIAAIFFPNEADEKYNQAIDNYKSGNYDLALKLVNESIRIDSLRVNPDYLILKGKIENEKGDSVNYRKTFQAALTSINNDSLKYFKTIELCDWALLKKDTTYAKELIGSITKIFSTKDSLNFTNSFLKAYSYYLDLNDTISGINIYKELSDSISNPIIYNQLGVQYYIIGESNNAISYYEKAIKLDSTNGVYYNNLGVAYQKINKTKQAINNYKLGVQYENEDACDNLREITAKTKYRKISRCWDGSISYSTGQGTCSHHGGIKQYEYQPYKEYTISWNCK